MARGWWFGAEVHAIFSILPLLAVFYEPVVGPVLELRWSFLWSFYVVFVGLLSYLPDTLH